MMWIFGTFLWILGLVLSDAEFNKSAGVSPIPNAKVSTSQVLWNASESNTSSVLEVYHKISEGFLKIMQNVTEEKADFDWHLQPIDFDEYLNESLGVDADGCDRSLRRQLENRCDEEYDRISFDAHRIEDAEEQTEALCCALEDFEKCNLRAFDKANCGKDKDAIRKNMNAARLFITVVANVTCSLNVDGDGCDRSLRQQLEKRCDEEYDSVKFDNNDLENAEKIKEICCALENYEKCSYEALDKANCGEDKADVRENVKAVRLFIRSITDVSCSKFRGLCAHPSAPNVPGSYFDGFGGILAILVTILL